MLKILCFSMIEEMFLLIAYRDKMIHVVKIYAERTLAYNRR